jgi:hypothetical protein
VQIRQSLANALRQGVEGLGGLVQRILQALVDFVQSTTLSDLTAYVLLLIAIVFAVFRIRWRLVRLPRLRTRECPRCGGKIHRIRRHRTDRLISLYVPVRRYVCKNRDCRWQGLRVGRE